MISADLRHGEIGGERRLSALTPFDTDADVRRLDHADVVTPIADRRGTLARVRAYQPDDLRLLSRRAPGGVLAVKRRDPLLLYWPSRQVIS